MANHEEQVALQLPDELSGKIFLELRHDDTLRFFHLVFRPAQGEFAINDMQDGVWNDEVRYRLPDGFHAATPVVLSRDGRRIRLLVGAAGFEWTIRPSRFGAMNYSAHCEGLSAHWIEPARQMAVGSDLTPTAIIIAGCRLQVPPGVDPAIAVDQQMRAWQTEADWMAGLAQAGVDGVHLPTPDPAVLALALATLTPGRDFSLTCAVPAVRSALGLLVRAAAITNLTLHAAPDPARATTLTRSMPAARPQLAAMPRPALQPGLDIIVSLYNTDRFIDACVDSLLADLPAAARIRVSVVDDGSTDAAPERLRARAATDPRIRLLSKPNGGCASARNYGRLFSDRTHLAFVDADDIVDPGFFGALFAVAEQTDAAVVQGGYARFANDDPTHRTVASNHPAPDPAMDLQVAGFAAREIARAEGATDQVAIWRRVHRRDHLDAQNLWFPEAATAFDDLSFEISLMASVETFWAVFGPLYLYRQHPGQDVAQADARHLNTLWQFSLAIGEAQAGGAALNPAEFATYLVNADWSASLLPSPLLGSFLDSLAELVVHAARRDAEADLTARATALIRHEDFAWHLGHAERAFAAPATDFDPRPSMIHPQMYRLARGLAAPWP